MKLCIGQHLEMTPITSNEVYKITAIPYTRVTIKTKIIGSAELYGVKRNA